MANAKKTTKPKKVGGRKKTPSRRPSSTREKPEVMATWKYVAIATLITIGVLALAYKPFIEPAFYRFKECNGHRIYSTCIPEGYSVYGIDISHHQGEINWNRLKKGTQGEPPITFVYIKATEGSDFLDLKFADNFVKAKEQGITRGAYHYFSKHSDGLAQAQMFIKNVKLEKGDLPPVVDVEEKPKDKKKFLQELKIFISKIEEHYGVKPIIYSYKKYREKYLSEQFFDKYPLWIAHYYVPKLDDGTEWLMWQCSDRGEVDGIVEKVDINIFNGSREQFNSLLIK